MEQGNIFLEDPTIWVVVSFVIFVLFAIILGRSKVTALLDGKIDIIKQQIAQAENLRIEAQNLLVDYEIKKQAAAQEAETIINDARLRAEDMHRRSEQDLNDTMQRREAMMQDRINRMQDNAIDEIRRHAAELSVNAAREIIIKNIEPDVSRRLIDQSIQKISDHLN